MHNLWFLVAAFFVLWGTGIPAVARATLEKTWERMASDAFAILIIAVGLWVAVRLG